MNLILQEILAALFGLVTKAVAGAKESQLKDVNLKDTILSSKINFELFHSLEYYKCEYTLSKVEKKSVLLEYAPENSLNRLRVLPLILTLEIELI